MNTCANHKEREADFYCPQCVQCFCIDCARVKKIERTEIKICPVCNDPIKAITVERDDPPFRSDLLDILRFPFHGYGLLALLVWPILAVIIRGFPVFVLLDFADSIAKVSLVFANPFFYFIYSTLVVAIFMQLVYGAGNGAFEFPMVRVSGSFMEMSKASSARLFSPFIAVFWPVMIVSFLFWLLFQPSSSMRDQIILWAFFIFIFACCAFAFFLLPMTLLLISMYTDPSLVFNPFYLFNEIKKIKKDYLIFLFGVASFLGIYIFVRQFVSGRLFSRSALFYIAYFSIDGAIQIYCVMTIGLLLGNMSFRRRYELKWLPHTDEKPEFIIEKKPPVEAGPIIEPSIEEELAEKMSNASYFLDHGNYEEAIDMFKRILEKQPDNSEALRGIVMAAVPVQNREIIRDFGGKLGAHFVKQRAHNLLWDAYNDYKKIIPNYVFDPPEMFEMAHWLDEQGMSLDAARALKELAVNRPKDDCAAKALHDCAQLLREKCNKLENAEQIFKLIIEKYPGSQFAGVADAILEELEVQKKKAKEKQEKEYLG